MSVTGQSEYYPDVNLVICKHIKELKINLYQISVKIWSYSFCSITVTSVMENR